MDHAAWDVNEIASFGVDRRIGEHVDNAGIALNQIPPPQLWRHVAKLSPVGFHRRLGLTKRSSATADGTELSFKV